MVKTCLFQENDEQANARQFNVWWCYWKEGEEAKTNNVPYRYRAQNVPTVLLSTGRQRQIGCS